MSEANFTVECLHQIVPVFNPQTDDLLKINS